MPVSFSKDTTELEASLGYCFREKGLLLEALTHKSYHHENPDASTSYNERMEFLGDSVLGLAVAEDLFHRRPLLTEADMSKMKSYLVNEAVLYLIATRLSLGKYLKLGKGEEASGGRHKRSILSDAVEALLGAVFLDSDYASARSVIKSLLNDDIRAVVCRKDGHDFKSELQEKIQGLFGVLPEYRIVKQEGEEHQKVFTADVLINGEVWGAGRGKSKKEAQMAAAREALARPLDG